MSRYGVSIDYSRRTALYRLFDSEGRLLYVGITFNPRNRWAGHSATKSWWKQVVRREIEWHETRYAAEAAERAAILAERPLYNIAGAEEPPPSMAPKTRRIRSAVLDEDDRELMAAAAQRRKSKAALQEADAELRSLIIKGRALGIGPSQLARWSGFTREWVAKIAPDPVAARKAAIQRRLDKLDAERATPDA